jgi:hypothetical protein
MVWMVTSCDMTEDGSGEDHPCCPVQTTGHNDPEGSVPRDETPPGTFAQ